MSIIANVLNTNTKDNDTMNTTSVNTINANKNYGKSILRLLPADDDDYYAVVDRFESKIDTSGGEDACHLWTAGMSGNGYGEFGIGKKVVSAHKVAYVLHHNRDLLGDEQVLHGRGCDKRCCNVKHLRSGTQYDNMQDRMAEGHYESVTGENCHAAKLTNSKVKAIRMLHEAKLLTNADLARAFKVSTAQICKIVHRQSWKHI